VEWFAQISAFARAARTAMERNKESTHPTSMEFKKLMQRKPMRIWKISSLIIIAIIKETYTIMKMKKGSIVPLSQLVEVKPSQ
jgi:hypothetical protein